jgi:hypothetical protein
MCRAQFSEAKCLLAENLVKKIKFRCKYDGCRRSLAFDCYESHAELCRYRPYKCPFLSYPTEKCLWEGTVGSVKGHIRKTHYLPSKRRNLTHARCRGQLPHLCEESNNTEWKQPAYCLGETFFMNIRMIDFNLYFCLRHTGLRYKTPSYDYRILVQEQNGSGSFSSHDRTKLFLIDIEKIFEKKDCAVITKEQWTKSRNNENIMQYEVHISKNS